MLFAASPFHTLGTITTIATTTTAILDWLRGSIPLQQLGNTEGRGARVRIAKRASTSVSTFEDISNVASRSRSAKIYADEGPVSSTYSDLETVKRETSDGGRRMSMAQLKEFVDGQVSEAHHTHKRGSLHHGGSLAYTHPAKEDLVQPKLGPVKIYNAMSPVSPKGEHRPSDGAGRRKVEVGLPGISKKKSSHYSRDTITMQDFGERIREEVYDKETTRSYRGSGSLGKVNFSIPSIESIVSSPKANKNKSVVESSTRDSLKEPVEKMRSLTLHMGGHNVSTANRPKLQLDLKDIYW